MILNHNPSTSVFFKSRNLNVQNRTILSIFRESSKASGLKNTALRIKSVFSAGLTIKQTRQRKRGLANLKWRESSLKYILFGSAKVCLWQPQSGLNCITDLIGHAYLGMSYWFWSGYFESINSLARNNTACGYIHS